MRRSVFRNRSVKFDYGAGVEPINFGYVHSLMEFVSVITAREVNYIRI